MNPKYDYLIVGAGLFGATFAWRASRAGKKCLIIDRRQHAGGNTYCQQTEGINVHQYGAHIFHTNNKDVWDFVNSLVPFNRYTNSPLACYQGKFYNLPFFCQFHKRRKIIPGFINRSDAHRNLLSGTHKCRSPCKIKYN